MNKPILGALGALALTLAACAGTGTSGGGGGSPKASAAKADVKVGVVISLTGVGNVYGPTQKNGVELAAQRINDAGGVNGAKLVLVIDDDQSTTDGGVTAFRKQVSQDRVVAAVPSFFLAYFLQILFIFIGGAAGHTVLPVFGYGLDSHLVLPLLALSAPAVATTAQLTAIRMGEVFDADFITTANAKGLLPSWIIRVHVLPHVFPVSLEAVGSGLRVAVASLPIVEYILVWNGIGFVALQAIALRDPVALTACAIVLGTLFTLTSLLLDLRRTRFH